MRRPAVVFAALLAGGCDTGPRAPALVTESVFTDPQVGVRFAVPDGWVISGRTVPPPGQFDRPMRLVSYIRPGAGSRAAFDVYLVDLPAGQALPAYLVAHPIGADKWTWPPAPEPATVANTPANKYTLTARTLKRELVAADRAGRLIVFVTTAQANDDRAFDQTRQAVASAAFE